VIAEQAGAIEEQAQRALRSLIHAAHQTRDTGAPQIPASVAEPLISEFRHAIRVGLVQIPRIPGPKHATKQRPGRDLLEFCRFVARPGCAARPWQTARAQGDLMTYVFDEELVPWLDRVPEVRLFDEASLAAERERMSEMLDSIPPYHPSRSVNVWDTTVSRSAKAPEVPVRVYRPETGEEAAPGLLYIHGGGFVLGNVDMVHTEVLQIADEVGAVVVSVDYRLAPEHPFPAPIEDCYAALTWLADHVDELGVNRSRLGVAGESAGGGLSAAVALLARDRSGPQLCFQYLGMPQLDDRLDTPSMKSYLDTPLWNRPNVVFSWTSYLGHGGNLDVSPYAAPARAEDLSHLPPAYVATCEFDPLRDEGITYAQRLLQAGVSTELHHYPRTFHGSVMIRSARITKRMVADARDALGRGLGVGGVNWR